MGKSREHDEVMRLLKDHGAVLERTKKHHIWRFPDGRIHVLPSSPSCAFAWKNQLSDLRKFLGVVDPARGTPGARREKKGRKSRQRFEIPIEHVAKVMGPNGRDALMAFRAKLVPTKVYVAEPEYIFVRHIPEFHLRTERKVWWKPWTWL